MKGLSQSHIHVSILPQTPSHPGCRITVSRVPCALQQVLAGYQLEIQQCGHVDPKLPNYPFPPFFPTGSHKLAFQVCESVSVIL